MKIRIRIRTYHISHLPIRPLDDMYPVSAEDVLPDQQAEFGGEFCEEGGVFLEVVLAGVRVEVVSVLVVVMVVDVVMCMIWLVLGMVVFIC